MTTKTVGYRVGWLIDGTGGPVVANQVVTVAAGRFRKIVDIDDPGIKEMTIVDLSDCTVFPALIDSHVHLVMSGSTEIARRNKQLSSGYEDRRKTIARHLRQHLACGVLAVRDGGDNNGDTLRFKYDPEMAPQEKMVTIAAAGRAFHAAGRYGKLIGSPVKPDRTLVQCAFGENTKRDHLKLVNSGLNSLSQFGVQTAPQFDKNELAAVVSAAKRQGQPTMVHANGNIPVKLAIEAGCDSIEHGFFMGRDNMRRMADKRVFWVPTAVTMKAYIDYLKNQGRRSDNSFSDISRKNLDHQLEQISVARQLGVAVALGTDSGSPGVHHGKSVKEELQLFLSAGFSVEGAIRCATRNGALLMGLTDRGKIAPGMRGDFLAVRAPVEKVPEALHDIVYRVMEGRRVDTVGLSPN